MSEIRHLRRAGEAIFKDRYTTKAKDLLRPWKSGETGAFGLVGLPLSKPSISHSGASFAPGAIRSALQGYTTYSGEAELELTTPIIDFGDLYMDPTDIIGNQNRLYEGMTDILATEATGKWVLLGGDHSVSYASIKAVKEKYESIGVIQFDAHHDFRNTEDGGPTNGTPFRRLLEEGVIQGDNLVQIGIRDFSNAKAYHDFGKEHGVKMYSMGNIRNDGIRDILEKERERLSKQVDRVYISLDMDVLDQAFAPGCPAIGPGGMNTEMLIEGISYLAKQEEVIAMDIVEIDPTVDIRNMTSRIAAYMILQLLKGKSC
ncbi:formiminoglutamase [Oceanobacillus limi]|uniref:Formimidoylglutamase n=1 Tax=Oceanobacillus limi TaxID=930131 RepID=A0A1I0F2L7_9BACI|nr:formimidoylglutamase [Oceanobacillus limi]SET52125.1 formiminoglutamase [Oceanobacillus limi]